MYNIEIHKVLKNGPKDKIYTIIGKKKTRRILDRGQLGTGKVETGKF